MRALTWVHISRASRKDVLPCVSRRGPGPGGYPADPMGLGGSSSPVSLTAVFPASQLPPFEHLP